jgi:hypothetical protein
VWSRGRFTICLEKGQAYVWDHLNNLTVDNSVEGKGKKEKVRSKGHSLAKQPF